MEIITDPRDVKRIRKYYEQLYARKLTEMYKFLKRSKCNIHSCYRKTGNKKWKGIFST